MAYKTIVTPEGKEVHVTVISDDERIGLDEMYKSRGLETATEKIEFLKKKLGLLFYHSRHDDEHGYSEERHLKALERAEVTS